MQIWANMEQRERKSEEGIAFSSEMAPVYWFGKHHKPTSRSETPPSHSHPQQVRHIHTVQAGTCTGTHMYTAHTQMYSARVLSQLNGRILLNCHACVEVNSCC